MYPRILKTRSISRHKLNFVDGNINAYSCRICRLEFFIVFLSLKITAPKCDSYTRIVQMNPPFASKGMYYYT